MLLRADVSRPVRAVSAEEPNGFKNFSSGRHPEYNAFMNRNIFIILSCLLILTAGSAAFAAPEQTTYAIWARLQEGTNPQEKNSTLHYAAKVKGKWAAPVQLPLNRGLHITPAIAEDRKQNIWIVWIEQTEEENILRYAVIRQNGTETGRVNPAGQERSYAPTILIDQNDTPLIAWSGVTTGRLADIYTGRWNGSGWDKPVMVNRKNDTPDITPLLGLKDKKRPWVCWLGISEKKLYARYCAQMEAGQWIIDRTAEPSETTKDFIRQRTALERELPLQAEKRLMAAVFTGLGYEIQSLSERFTTFNYSGE